MRLYSGFSRRLTTRAYLLRGKHIIEYVCRRSCFNAAKLVAAYQPRMVETDQEKHYILPNAYSKCKIEPWRMLLPPPNVTGNLHLGHALNATIQDVICRQRLHMGYEVEWIPGTDHAGIATQVVVEKKMLKEHGITRHQMGRKKFLEEVWKWKEEKGDNIKEDLKKLGCLLDWDNEYFTMDKWRERAVNAAFIRLFEKGLIYRQNSLVNWSCALESAISDIEVDTLEVKGPTMLTVPGYENKVRFGVLYEIRYRVCGTNEEIIVCTTRPETMLGDVAVAVHPDDLRYANYRERDNEVKLWHPFRNEPIPLIFDLAVDPNFGSGAVKITPAHDKMDFEIAKRHLLEPISVFTEKGTIRNCFHKFQDMPRFDARKHILESLEEMDLLEDERNHSMSIPICSRSKDIIEYMVRPQWFLHCKTLAQAAAAEVRSGRLQIIPADYEVDWYEWLDNCRDWCVSRQLWWGHRIPVYCAKTDKGNELWIAAQSKDEAVAKANESMFNITSLHQDQDVLDTWFSSSLLPFSAFNWPDDDYKEHYPLNVLQTGHDILFFWVARMVMLGLELTGEVPFKRVLLNGIVCDAQGRKMSKSLGNVITPQQVIKGATRQELENEIKKSHEDGLISSDELKKSLVGVRKLYGSGIPECGTDALRFTLCSHNIKNRFINFDVAECHTNKLFLNKIWQATRFTLGATEKMKIPLNEIETMNQVPLHKWDLWILSRLVDLLQKCGKSFGDYNFHLSTAALKQFMYYNLCDVYLETTKASIKSESCEAYLHCATLVTCLSWGLQIMAPFTPFIAAELLQHLPRNIELNLLQFHNVELEQEIEQVLNICQQVRQLKARNEISKKHEPQLHLYTETPEVLELLHLHRDQIKCLTMSSGLDIHLNTVSHSDNMQEKYDFFSTAGHLCSFGIKTNDTYKQPKNHITAIDELNKKKLVKLEKQLEQYRLCAEDPGYRQAASQRVQQQHAEKIKQLEAEISNIKKFSK